MHYRMMQLSQYTPDVHCSTMQLCSALQLCIALRCQSALQANGGTRLLQRVQWQAGHLLIPPSVIHSSKLYREDWMMKRNNLQYTDGNILRMERIYMRKEKCDSQAGPVGMPRRIMLATTVVTVQLGDDADSRLPRR